MIGLKKSSLYTYSAVNLYSKYTHRSSGRSITLEILEKADLGLVFQDGECQAYESHRLTSRQGDLAQRPLPDLYHETDNRKAVIEAVSLTTYRDGKRYDWKVSGGGSRYKLSLFPSCLFSLVYFLE